MKNTVRIEIIAQSKFWRDAFVVEWEYQHPERRLAHEADGNYLVQSAWLEDLACVASQCFAHVRIAPADPKRREIFRRLLPLGEK